MIELQHIEKIFDSPKGPVHVLKGIDLSIKKGEIFGIIGLSGAGKSTLVRCINMLERPTAGTVIVDGKDMTKLTDSELRQARKNIGMIFQHFNLLSSATVYDNVAFPLRLSDTPEETIKEKVSSLLELVGLSAKADQYPSQLSGGQKQRVGIARALASDPKILICDEATSALDPQTTKAILDLIRDINKKFDLTVVIITHEMQVIKDICDKVAILENGIIAEQGLVLDVFTDPQCPITREFISIINSNDLPIAYRGQEISPVPVEGATLLVRLTFVGEKADDPVINELIRATNVTVSILFGAINQVQHTPYGRLIVGFTGSQSDIDAAFSFLSKKDGEVEVIGYVRRND